MMCSYARQFHVPCPFTEGCCGVLYLEPEVDPLNSDGVPACEALIVCDHCEASASQPRAAAALRAIYRGEVKADA